MSEIYVINGFYMAMREKYTKDGASLNYFVVEWPQSALSWEDFRGKVLGGTDPKDADPASMRHDIFKRWKARVEGRAQRRRQWPARERQSL